MGSSGGWSRLQWPSGLRHTFLVFLSALYHSDGRRKHRVLSLVTVWACLKFEMPQGERLRCVYSRCSLVCCGITTGVATHKLLLRRHSQTTHASRTQSPRPSIGLRSCLMPDYSAVYLRRISLADLAI